VPSEAATVSVVPLTDWIVPRSNASVFVPFLVW